MTKANEIVRMAGRYLSRQRPEVVLLFALVGLVAAGLYYLPGVAERLADRIASTYEADQERDQRTLNLLLERIAAERRRDQDNLVGHP